MCYSFCLRVLLVLGVVFLSSAPKYSEFTVVYNADLSKFELPSEMPVRITADFHDRLKSTPDAKNELRWLAEPNVLTEDQTKKVIALFGKAVLINEWPKGLMQGPTFRIEYIASGSIKVRYVTFYFHESETRFLCTIDSLPFALQNGKEFKRDELHPYYELFWAVGRERVGP